MNQSELVKPFYKRDIQITPLVSQYLVANRQTFFNDNDMFSNWLCLIFASFEVFFYSGVVFGYGFLQFIFEKENVFWKEHCYDRSIHTNCTKSNSKF